MYFVGIDCGGTKSEIVICDENANIVGYSYLGANCSDIIKMKENPYFRFGYGRNLEIISKAFNEATKDLDKSQKFFICSDYSYAKNILCDLNIDYEFKTIHEFDCIINSVNLDRAYVVLSGTGAFTTYINENESLYFDGLGPILGDYGSGYYIGLKAIKAVAMNDWDESYKTSMYSVINEKIINEKTNSCGGKLSHPFLQFTGRSEVSSFAPIVNQEAEKGDKIAIEILQEAGEKLGNTVRCLVKNVRPNPNNFPLVCDGSVIKKCRIYRESFIEYCKKNVPENEILFSPMPQAFGAIMFCIKENKPDIRDEFYNKLLNNYNKKL